MNNLPIGFDFEEGINSTLEEILTLVSSTEVDPDTLLSVTIPASFWFDVLQSISIAGAMLMQVSDQLGGEIEKEVFGQIIERNKAIYNDVSSSLIELTKQTNKQ